MERQDVTARPNNSELRGSVLLETCNAAHLHPVPQDIHKRIRLELLARKRVRDERLHDVALPRHRLERLRRRERPCIRRPAGRGTKECRPVPRVRVLRCEEDGRGGRVFVSGRAEAPDPVRVRLVKAEVRAGGVAFEAAVDGYGEALVTTGEGHFEVTLAEVHRGGRVCGKVVLR